MTQSKARQAFKKTISEWIDGHLQKPKMDMPELPPAQQSIDDVINLIDDDEDEKENTDNNNHNNQHQNNSIIDDLKSRLDSAESKERETHKKNIKLEADIKQLNYDLDKTKKENDYLKLILKGLREIIKRGPDPNPDKVEMMKHPETRWASGRNGQDNCIDGRR